MFFLILRLYFVSLCSPIHYNTMNIKIFNDIGECCPVNFDDIVAQIAEMPANDNEINLFINSHGGECFEAFKIYDALRETGKIISAHVVGECSSAATLLLLAAAKDRRTANPNATILIHNPYCYTVGDAGELQKTADELQAITDRFINIYVNRTGTDAETLTAIMNENKPIDAQRAMQLGFINTIKTPLSNKNRMKEQIKSAFLALGRALGVMALSVETADGVTLEFERENGDPETGDKVNAPDGNYLMPSGETYVIEGGVLVEIIPAKEDEPEPEPEPENDNADRVAELEQENADLRAEIAELKANAKSDADREILAAVNVAGGREWLAKVTSGELVVAPKTDPDSKPAGESFKEYYNRTHNK